MINYMNIKIVISAALIVIAGFLSKTDAQTNYDSKMRLALQKFQSATTEIDFNSASKLFAAVGLEQKTKWLPYYYAGLCKTLAALKLKTKNADVLCNEADVFINKSDSLNQNNSELYVLKSMNFSARLNVNPQGRALKYNKQINKANEAAIKLNPNNPRAYLQKAQAIYYTPENFGGGKKKALPFFEEALTKYKTYKAEDALMPHWGKDIAEKMIVDCRK